MRHDQSAMVIYCNRKALIPSSVFVYPLMILVGVVGLIFVAGEYRFGIFGCLPIVASIVIVPLFSSLWLLTIYRLVRPGPTLIISQAGITDNASLIGYGAGFIPWDEIAALRCYTYRVRIGRSLQYLCIVPRDPARFWSRRDPLSRLLAIASKPTLPARTGIEQRMLSQPIPEVLAQVAKQYQHELHHNSIAIRLS